VVDTHYCFLWLGACSPDESTFVSEPGYVIATYVRPRILSVDAAFTSFGGASHTPPSTYTTPSLSSEWWAGFVHLHDEDPSFPRGGTLSFDARVAEEGEGTSVTVRFKYEHDAHPDVSPSFEAGQVTVVGSDVERRYTVTLPNQNATNTYRSLLLYLDTKDVAVEITNVQVSIVPP